MEYLTLSGYISSGLLLLHHNTAAFDRTHTFLLSGRAAALGFSVLSVTHPKPVCFFSLFFFLESLICAAAVNISQKEHVCAE